MAWLVYIDTPRGPSPRIIYDGGPVCPELGETERRYGVLKSYPIQLGEAALGLDALVRRYPPPAPKGDAGGPDDPAPTSPAPAKPRDGGGVARELEVA